MLYALYTNATAKRSAEVRISRDMQGREVVITLLVSGKRQARTEAAFHNAKPWNF
jgi:hypothetical protein